MILEVETAPDGIVINSSNNALSLESLGKSSMVVDTSLTTISTIGVFSTIKSVSNVWFMVAVQKDLPAIGAKGWNPTN